MMAFVNQLFPSPRLIHGLQKALQSPVLVIGNNQIEYRLKKLANYRTSWTWPARGMLTTDRQAISNFYTDVAAFSLNSFKFQDPDGSKWSSTPLTYAGSGNYFYLTTRGTADTHPVFHIGSDVVVSNSSNVSVSFTKTLLNGKPVISVPGYTSGVTITGTFYYAVRFDQARMDWSIEVLTPGDVNNTPYGDNIGDLALLEVFEY
jgi:hypothetical protein